jgi:hypothetical protein
VDDEADTGGAGRTAASASSASTSTKGKGGKAKGGKSGKSVSDGDGGTIQCKGCFMIVPLHTLSFDQLAVSQFFCATCSRMLQEAIARGEVSPEPSSDSSEDESE